MRIRTTTPLRAAAIRALDGGAAILVPFTAVFHDDQLQVDLVVDVRDGRPTCVRYSVERVDGGDIALMTTEVMRGLPLRSLMGHACVGQLLTPTADGGYESGATTEAIEALLGTLRRRRDPITDERLRRVADVWRQCESEGIDTFALRLGEAEGRPGGFEQRQAYRLIKLARERGFLSEGDDR